MRRCLALRMCLSAALRGPVRSRRVRGSAQDSPQRQHQRAATTSQAWQWGVEANVFAGYNYQYRKFTDFDEIESQNWLMTHAGEVVQQRIAPAHRRDVLVRAVHAAATSARRRCSRPAKPSGRAADRLPASARPDHEPRRGVLATRSAHRRSSLAGRTSWGRRRSARRCSCTGRRPRRIRRRRWRITISMPRTSRPAWWRSASSARGSRSKPARFTARSRTRIASTSTPRRSIPTACALSWADGPWALQLSGADLKTPERKSPYDATRVTASVSYFKGDANRSIAWLAAFGQNREVFGNLEAYLLEGDARGSEARVLHARRDRWPKTFSMPAFIRSAPPTRTGNRRSAP